MSTGEYEIQAGEPAAGRAARTADWSWRTARRIQVASRRRESWLQLLQFALVGAGGYAVNLTVFALLAQTADLHHLLAAVGAFCVAVTNNFAWNRAWTFRGADGHAGFQAARFFAVSLAGLGLNLALLELLISSAGVAELPAQAAAVALTMPVNFIGNKLWTFG